MLVALCALSTVPYSAGSGREHGPVHPARVLDHRGDVAVLLPGGRFTYEFPASHAGTFMYHSHLSAVEQPAAFAALLEAFFTEQP